MFLSASIVPKFLVFLSATTRPTVLSSSVCPLRISRRWRIRGGFQQKASSYLVARLPGPRLWLIAGLLGMRCLSLRSGQLCSSSCRCIDPWAAALRSLLSPSAWGRGRYRASRRIRRALSSCSVKLGALFFSTGFSVLAIGMRCRRASGSWRRGRGAVVTAAVVGMEKNMIEGDCLIGR